MKRFFSLTLGMLAAIAAQAADTIYTKSPQIPILLERNDNVLFTCEWTLKRQRHWTK